MRDLKALSGPTPFPTAAHERRKTKRTSPGRRSTQRSRSTQPAPRTIVASWQQDLGFGGRGDRIRTSRDGGRTW